MGKLISIIRFEVMRSLKKPSFWIAAIAIPIVMAAYIGICALAGYNAGEAVTNTDTSDMKIAIFDEANQIKVNKLSSEEDTKTITRLSSKEEGIQGIKENKYELFYYIPENFRDEFKINIYAKPEKISIISDYSGPITQLLEDSIRTKIGSVDFNIIKNGAEYETVIYDKDNSELTKEDIIKRAAAPIIALALFYLIMITLGNRLSVSMVEEKENRISELLLTSIKPIQLISAKTISLMIIGMIQVITTTLPAIALSILAQKQGFIPFEVKNVLDRDSLLQYGALFLASYFFFTVCNVLLGTLTSTAKDASSFAGVIILPLFMPFIFFSVFMNNDSLLLSRIFTFVPLSAPTTIMIRGVFNTIEPWEFYIGLGSILISSFLLLKLATFIFCRNAIVFGSKIDFKKTFGSTRTSWEK